MAGIDLFKAEASAVGLECREASLYALLQGLLGVTCEPQPSCGVPSMSPNTQSTQRVLTKSQGMWWSEDGGDDEMKEKLFWLEDIGDNVQEEYSVVLVSVQHEVQHEES